MVICLTIASTACSGAVSGRQLASFPEQREFKYDVTFGVIRDPATPDLITLVAFGHQSKKQLARIERVEATAPLIRRSGVMGVGAGNIYLIPVIGPGGEQQTRAFIYEETATWGRREALAALAGPVPRVVEFPSTKKDVFSPAAYAIPVPATTGLFVPFDAKQVPLPAGTIGVVPVSVVDGSPAWIAWLVRWEGAQGAGWSVSRDPALKGFADAGPRWTNVIVTRTNGGRIVVGRPPGGGCEVLMVEADYYSGDTGRSATAATCDDAGRQLVASVEAGRKARAAQDQRERLAAKALADEARAREEANRAEWAQLTAETTAAGKPAPEFTWYEDLIKSGNLGLACSKLTALDIEVRATLVRRRLLGGADVTQQEIVCLSRYRFSAGTQVSVDRALSIRRDRERYRAALPVDDARHSAGGSSSSSTWTGPSSSGPSHAEQMRQINDYTYGSGRASSCPFSDRSLC